MEVGTAAAGPLSGYVPSDDHRGAVEEVRKGLWPQQTLVVEGDQDLLPPVALDRVRRRYVDDDPVLQLMTSRVEAA